MPDLGDLSDFLKEGDLSNLDWLDVDEEKYHAGGYPSQGALPKQNLDVVPDLQALWDRQDKPTTTYLVPNSGQVKPFPGAGEVHTMGDLSEVHGRLRARAEDIAKTTRYAMMQSSDTANLRRHLMARFDLETLRANRDIIAEVLKERGLLGTVYVSASDFPNCANSPKSATTFVRRYASDAKYIVAKPECTGCIHAKKVGGSTNCSVFHKQVVLDVPYTEQLAAEVEQLQQMRGKTLQAASVQLGKWYTQSFSDKELYFYAQGEQKNGGTSGIQVTVDLTKPRAMPKAVKSSVPKGFNTLWKEVDEASVPANVKSHVKSASLKARVKNAFLASDPAPASHVYTGVGENQLPKQVSMAPEAIQEQLIAASSLTRKRDEQRLELLAKPVIAFIRRELLKGRTASELAAALKVSFHMSELAETRSQWEPHFKEAGLFGHVYSTQDSFDECREGADFLAKHNPGIRAMVVGSKCESCIYNKISRCMLYGKPLVKEASEVLTWPIVEAVLLENKNAGRIPAWEKAASLGTMDPRQALKIIHGRINSDKGLPQQVSGQASRMDVFHQWAGGQQGHVASGQAKREIVKTARRYLNEGLYGRDLMAALKARFEVRDIAAAKDDLKPVVAEQGLQGIYYVDASAYDDYGHGCEEASRLYRAKQVPYVKLGSKCGSCVFNHNQHCSKLNKPLVVEPPYVNKVEQQKAVLASGSSTEISAPSLMAPSGLSMIAEYQLQNGGMDIELGTEITVPPVELVIGKTKVKV